MTYGIPDIGETGSVAGLYSDRHDTDAVLIRALCYHLNMERTNGKMMSRELEKLKRAIREAGYEAKDVKHEQWTTGPVARIEFVTELVPVEEMGS